MENIYNRVVLGIYRGHRTCPRTAYSYQHLLKLFTLSLVTACVNNMRKPLHLVSYLNGSRDREKIFHLLSHLSGYSDMSSCDNFNKNIFKGLVKVWVKTALPHPTDKVNREIEISENSIKIIILSGNPIYICLAHFPPNVNLNFKRIVAEVSSTFHRTLSRGNHHNFMTG